ncbi:hypothetical protein [uncultured Veillonella sp.]|uniref:hypothetical protein n=1 Tax=uncultured Veillonella sp. TaxID=159268 RepID=UPI0025E8D0D0|nr:hypothetical protein [uncultured Veillonella sp.]MDY3974549.1 hypothetical protein [Veillonella caviae]
MKQIDIVMQKFATWLRNEWGTPEDMIQPIIDAAKEEMPNIEDLPPLVMDTVFYPHLAAKCLAQVIAKEIGIPTVSKKRLWGKIGMMLQDEDWNEKKEFLKVCLRRDYRRYKNS